MTRRTYYRNQQREGTLSDLRRKKLLLRRRYARQIVEAIRKDSPEKCGHVLTDDTTIGVSKHCISAACDEYIRNSYQQFMGEWRGLEKTCDYNARTKPENSRKKKKGGERLLSTMREAMKTLDILRRTGVEMENMTVPNQKEKNRRRIDTMLARLDAA